MCLKCAMEASFSRRTEAMDWMSKQMTGVPDGSVVRFAQMFEECMPMVVRTGTIQTREDALKILAGFFFGLKMQGDEVNKAIQHAFSEGELRGHAA